MTDNLSEDYNWIIKEFGEEKYQINDGIYIHREIKNLSKPIFRYIRLEYLLSMLEKNVLYIPNRKAFLDKSEIGFKVNPKNTFPLSIVSENEIEDKKEGTIAYKRWTAAYSVCVSCWTYDSLSNSKVIDENYLMWRSYGSIGVCCRIQTTISELLSSIDNQNDYKILASNVSYVQEHLSDGFVQHYIFEKPIYYQDEKEFRLCVLSQDDFVNLKIDPFKMIKSITISPFITDSYSNFIIESIKHKYPQWDVQLNKSNILEF